MVEQGLKPITQVLHQHVVPANPTVAKYLKLEPETPVIEIARLRSVQGVPIPNLVTDDLNNQSLRALLESRYHLYIGRGRQTIQAVLAEGREAKRLEVNKGAPLFRLDSISYLNDGTPVEYYFAYNQGDCSQFEVELFAAANPMRLSISQRNFR
ncbi:MAG: UTRA domain-containing protein [Anaerolineaceae bacterium]|nr:UTRA domain-containing protein [Anaerolineaceae bacterium]